MQNLLGEPLFKDAAGRYFIKFADGIIIDIPMPQALVDRVFDSWTLGTMLTLCSNSGCGGAVTLYFARRSKMAEEMTSLAGSLSLST